MIPAILSGGAGTRLWPVSRSKFPKQFCQFFEKSLLEQTLHRLSPIGSPWIITVSALQTLTEKTLTHMNLPMQQSLYEPVGKNTAPAVALLCKVLEMKGMAEEIAGFFPADHLIEDQSIFLEAVELAKTLALQDYIVTLGILPTAPATGFGYIETSPQELLTSSNLSAHPTLSFREKPDAATAQSFIETKRFFWNAGMFVFKISLMIKYFKTYAPDVWSAIDELKADLSNLKEVYAKCPSISLDYAIMEKVSKQACIPCNMGWSDLGSWDDLSEAMILAPSSFNFAEVLEDKTPETNQTNSKSTNQQIAKRNPQTNFVFTSYPKTVGLVGVEDLIVVDTPDALLISRKGHTQNIKSIVDQIKTLKPNLANDHPFEFRPWGKFEILRDEENYKSKIITVNPNSQLSYQSHENRAEHWVMVSGRGEVVLNNVVHPVITGDHIFIPLKAKHRMRNPYSEPLEFVEVQTGTYFGEDDITRYQDDYGRSPESV